MSQFTFTDRALVAELVAKMLWEIKAVHFNSASPYTFASGMKSPVYIDMRKLISYPRIRSAVMDFAAAKIVADAGFEIRLRGRWRNRRHSFRRFSGGTPWPADDLLP